MRALIIVLVIVAFCLTPTTSIVALDAVNTLQFSPLAGWQGFELVTQGDNISAIGDAGYGSTAARGVYDGLGAYHSGSQLEITLNHETTPAAISGVFLDLSAFRQALQSTVDGGVTPLPGQFVERMGFAYETIYDGSYDAATNADPVASGTVAVAAYGQQNFARFCSGSTYRANTFGLHQGFVDPVYITGEETSGGRFTRSMLRTDTLWETARFRAGQLGKCSDHRYRQLNPRGPAADV